jgi:hypothetical protein
MAKNVRFIQTTKAKYLARDSYDEHALYFCIDTNELFKGSNIYTDGIRIVETKLDLPEYTSAADGIVYYVRSSRNGYTISPDRTEWLQTIYAPVMSADEIPESEIYNTVTTVGAVRDIEAKIYQRIAEVTSQGLDALTPVDGTIYIINTENGGKSIGVSLAPVDGNALVAVEGGLFAPQVSVNPEAANGLVAVDGTLSLNLATSESAGAMSASDKRIIDSMPYIYETRKFDVCNVPTGTLVDYRDHEIRVMCPIDADFNTQSGEYIGDPNVYYMLFKNYAPKDAVYFKKGERGVIDEELFSFYGAFAGIDEFGRKHSVCLLPIATYDSMNDKWMYYGNESTESQYFGWDYVVEWYDENYSRIGFDSMRINLSNENCHYVSKPYYINEVLTATDAEEIKAAVAGMKETYSWGEMF